VGDIGDSIGPDRVLAQQCSDRRRFSRAASAKGTEKLLLKGRRDFGRALAAGLRLSAIFMDSMLTWVTFLMRSTM
jgi:hypothetical protein